MATSTLSPATASVPLRQDAQTIALIGLAHGTSHFFHMLLPPLFPLFIRDFGLSYTELGVLVTVFFAISGGGQAASGFLVDRVGARPVLYGAMVMFALAALAGASAQGYGGLLLAAALAGVGNAPFHPADFTILNKRVSTPRLGHAFSVHGISGNLGWAAAPIFMLGLTGATGSWRIALALAAAWAAIVLALLVWQRRAIDDRAVSRAAPATAAAAAGAPDEHPLAFLKQSALWLCFSFFFWVTASLSAVQSFASPALQQLYGLPLAATAGVVTGYMLCGALGMVGGGFLVGRVARLEWLVAACLASSALLLATVGTGALPAGLAVGVASLAGLGIGLANPSRDMLIRRAAPPGATGRVYGTVYSGLDLGFAVSAPIFGAIMDHGAPSGVFHGAALALLAGVASATLVGMGVANRRSGAATMAG